MVGLLGPRDELLKLMEARLDSEIHVRGNEITVTGEPGDNALAIRLFEELVQLMQSGHDLTADSVGRTLGILQADTEQRPAEVLSLNILSRRGKN
ncbi:MAG: PhoH family protein, partial [Jatrophihabitantaceae bacterium]